MSSHRFGLSTFGSTLNALGFTFSSLRPCGAGVAASSARSAPITPSAVAAAVPPAAWMNCRRLRYAFLSVISKLRTSGGRLISISQLYEPFGAHPGEIPDDQAQVAGGSPQPAVLFPPPRRRQCLF